MTPRQLSAWMELHVRDDIQDRANLLRLMRAANPRNKNYKKQQKQLDTEAD